MKALAALFLMAGALCAAPSIRGRVLDPANAAIPDAQVQLTSTTDSSQRRQTRTRPDGTFEFSNVSVGEYLLEATAPGLSSVAPTRVRPGETGTESLDLVLDIAATATRVEVTAAATPLTTAQVSRSTDILDANAFERMERTHLADALQFLPGLRVQRLGGPGSFTRILPRGLRPMDTALLIDGFRLRDAASTQGDATAFLGDLLVVDADRVEVLRGAGASLYGTHASGAAINVVTDQGGGPFRGDIAAEGGGLGVVRGVARGSGSLLDGRLSLSGGLAHMNVTRGIDGDDRNRNASVQAFAGYQLLPQTRLIARVLASNAFLQLNVSPHALPAADAAAPGPIQAIPNVNFAPAPNDPDSSRSAYFVSGLFAVSHNFAPATNARVSWQTITTQRDNRDGPAGPNFQPLFNNIAWLEGKVDTLQARIDHSFTSRLLISGGYEWEREAFDSRTKDQNPEQAARVNARSRVDQSSNALFLQNQIRLLSDRLQVSLSGRWQNFSLARPAFFGGASVYESVALPDAPRALTGDASIAYFFPTTGTKLRAHVGNGFRAPALFERFGTYFSFGSFSAFGDPRLRPERLLSTEVGVDQYLWRDRIRIRTTYFYTKIQESIVFSFDPAVVPPTDPFGRVGGYANARGGLARGAEFAIDLAPARGTLVQTSYTYTNSDEPSGVRALRIPDHSFTLRANQTLWQRLDVATDILATSSYTYPLFTGSGSRDFVFKGPLRADVAVHYTIPLRERLTARLYTRIENITNRRRYEDGFPAPRAWAVAGVKLIF